MDDGRCKMEEGSVKVEGNLWFMMMLDSINYVKKEWICFGGLKYWRIFVPKS